MKPFLWGAKEPESDVMVDAKMFLISCVSLSTAGHESCLKPWRSTKSLNVQYCARLTKA